MKCNLPQSWQDEEWLTKNPERVSFAQVSVNNYLRDAQGLYRGKKALHIGVGNSSMYKDLHGVFSQIDGITNTKQELEMAKGYRVYLVNKYDADEFSKLDGDYDVINDVNLKSFACCNDHWIDFMKTVVERLKIGGRLISHTAGFGGHGSLMDNSTTMKEMYQLLQPSCFLFEMKHLADESGYYPFIIEKT